MSAAMEIEQDSMANSCVPSQLHAMLLTATVTAAAGSAVAIAAPPASTRKSSGKSEELSEAETDTTADAETVEQDSSTASDTEVDDVDVDGWKEITSRMATVFSPAQEVPAKAFPHGFKPPPGLEPVHVRLEGWNAVAGSLLQGLQQGSSAKANLPGDDDEEDSEEEEYEKEENHKYTVDSSEWKSVGIRVLHVLTALQVED